MLKISILFIALYLPAAMELRQIKLAGAWKVVEVQTLKKDGSSTSVYPTQSQLLFTGKYFSFCWTTQTADAKTWAMSDSVKLARVNNSLINTGTYELDGSNLAMKAGFALNPKFVGGTATYTVQVIKDTLILSGTSVVSADNQPNPAYAAGSRFITKLVRL